MAKQPNWFNYEIEQIRTVQLPVNPSSGLIKAMRDFGESLIRTGESLAVALIPVMEATAACAEALDKWIEKHPKEWAEIQRFAEENRSSQNSQ